MEDHDGNVISIRAWGFHASLRHRKHVTDFDFDSLKVGASYCAGVPRVAFKASREGWASRPPPSARIRGQVGKR